MVTRHVGPLTRLESASVSPPSVLCTTVTGPSGNGIECQVETTQNISEACILYLYRTHTQLQASYHLGKITNYLSQIRTENADDNLPRHSVARVHGVALDHRQLDTETV